MTLIRLEKGHRCRNSSTVTPDCKWMHFACANDGFLVAKAKYERLLCSIGSTCSGHGSEVQAALLVGSDWTALELTVVNTRCRGKFAVHERLLTGDSLDYR